MRTFSTLYKELTGVFPEVKAKNASTDLSVDGTDWSAINIDDLLWGWIQALLDFVGQSPDGVPETFDQSQIFNAMKEAFNTADHSDVLLNTTHRSSNGSDHGFIDQDLKTTASPVFNGINTDNVILKTKVIEIGDWDMNATVTIDVAHSLTYDKIRNVQVMIRNDLDNILSLLNTAVDVSGAAISGDIGSINSTNVVLRRMNGGLFDNTGYDLTSFNRGWVTITYEE